MEKNYLGIHTTVGHLTPFEWKHIPYLNENEGHLPPFIIAVGDRRRVEYACSTLNLKNTIRLHNEGEQLLGLKGRGRVDMAIGEFSFEKKSIPILITETQMGMPSTEIILKEIIFHTKTKYSFNATNIETDACNLIRVGTAGGINSDNESIISIGDIVNSSFSVGWAGTILESLGGLNFSDKETINRFMRKWKDLGLSFTDDNKFPLAKNSKILISNIKKGCDWLGINSHIGGNFSKDSLYAEIDDKVFVNLRNKYNILSTEMEQIVIAKVAAESCKQGFKVNTGLISAIIGLIPGESFALAEKHKKIICKVEENSIKAAALALWNMIYKKGMVKNET